MSGNPVLGFQFSIDVTGVVPITGYFTEVGGIGTEIDVIQHKTVDILGRSVTQMIPGREKWNPVTLKRGITDSMGFWIWYEMVFNGLVSVARSSVSIVLYDRNYTPMVQWDMDNAWPSKISGPQIRSDNSEVAVEELTLVYEGIRRSFFPGAGLGFLPGPL
ncbi:MAG: phage tail protein [Ardenticatenales bacterium]|nr:phage tail protein [Ardenticatenales bacterium]